MNPTGNQKDINQERRGSMQGLPTLVGSGGGKLPPTTATIVSSSDDGEFEGIMMHNNMYLETKEAFALPLTEDVVIYEGRA